MHDISLASFSSSVFSVFIQLHWFIFFYVTSRTLRKVRTSWSESTVIHIKVINHPDCMDLLFVSLRMRQMKDCSRERAQSDRKKEISRLHELGEWSVGGDVRWAHDLKQDKCHSKLKTLITNQIQSTSSWDTLQVQRDTKQVSTGRRKQERVDNWHEWFKWKL